MMDNFSLDKVQILLIEPDQNIRLSLRKILTDAGFRKIKEGSSLKDIMYEFQISMPDMIICDINLSDGNFNTFVYKLRHHDVGTNPFLPVLAMASSPTTDDIRAVVQAGADDLIAKPISPRQMLQHIKALITSRKPFMVTSSYIGPDRRKETDKDRPGREKITSVQVPNILKEKTVDPQGFCETQIQQDIRASINMVNLQKLGRHANQTAALIDKIVPSLMFGAPDDVTVKALDRLLYVSEDIARRMVGTKFDHVSELCQSLIEVTQRIIEAKDFPAPKDVDLLQPLSAAIARGFDENNMQTAETVHKISQSIHNK